MVDPAPTVLRIAAQETVIERIITQIYEIQDPHEAEKMIELSVDRIGSVVLSEETWRVPRIRETISVVERSSSQSSLIPLFSDMDAVCRALDYYAPDIVHFCDALFHGKGLREDCETLCKMQNEVKQRFPEIGIMRSIPIPAGGSGVAFPVLEIASIFQPASDFFLTDTLILTGDDGDKDRQPVNGFVGITGMTCDWDSAKRLVQFSGIPVILAGGISPDNVFDALSQTTPAGVDSCTCTNAVGEDGRPIRFRKDVEKVRRLVSEVRRWESAHRVASDKLETEEK